jgi:hypothetical protein
MRFARISARSGFAGRLVSISAFCLGGAGTSDLLLGSIISRIGVIDALWNQLQQIVEDQSGRLGTSGPASGLVLMRALKKSKKTRKTARVGTAKITPASPAS